MIWELFGLIGLFVGFYAGVVGMLTVIDHGEGRLLEDHI